MQRFPLNCSNLMTDRNCRFQSKMWDINDFTVGYYRRYSLVNSVIFPAQMVIIKSLTETRATTKIKVYHFNGLKSQIAFCD